MTAPLPPSWLRHRFGNDYVDYRDWDAASPEQRRVWNCALDVLLDRPPPPPPPSAAPGGVPWRGIR